MSWHDIAGLGAQVRPLEEPRPPRGYTWSRFGASLSATVETLARELRHLDAKRIVLQLDLRERDIRIDGFPRADARPSSPAVVLAFESKWGALRYATGEFEDWKDNLRAIALSMEALRKVDRYGVSKRGEQYTGWRAIPQRTGAFPSREEAARFLESHGGFRAGARKLHPDNPETGDEETFKQLVAAKELVET